MAGSGALYDPAQLGGQQHFRACRWLWQAARVAHAATVGDASQGILMRHRCAVTRYPEVFHAVSCGKVVYVCMTIQGCSALPIKAFAHPPIIL